MQSNCNYTKLILNLVKQFEGPPNDILHDYSLWVKQTLEENIKKYNLEQGKISRTDPDLKVKQMVNISKILIRN